MFSALRSSRVPILMYHQVCPRPLRNFEKYSVTTKAFAAQMSWLAGAGYRSIGIDALVKARTEECVLPRRPVLITFDDAFQGAMEAAAPVLRSHGFTATFYVVADLVGRNSEWLRAERGVNLSLIDWRTIRTLEAEGHACGAHSMTHPRLAELAEAACRRELTDSRMELENNLGHEVRDFSYPFGSYNWRVRQWAQEAGYRSACSVRIGLSDPDDDLLALHRVPVSGNDSLFDFACRLRLAYTLPELARRKAAGMRKRLRLGTEA